MIGLGAETSSTTTEPTTLLDDNDPAAEAAIETPAVAETPMDMGIDGFMSTDLSESDPAVTTSVFPEDTTTTTSDPVPTTTFPVTTSTTASGADPYAATDLMTETTPPATTQRTMVQQPFMPSVFSSLMMDEVLTSAPQMMGYPPVPIIPIPAVTAPPPMAVMPVSSGAVSSVMSFLGNGGMIAPPAPAPTATVATTAATPAGAAVEEEEEVEEEETEATPAAATPAAGGGIDDLETVYQIQYQNGGELDTYGDSEDETDYSEIPAESLTQNADGSITMSADNDGGGSDNSDYSRTELREKEEWEIMTGTHSMSGQYTDISGGRQTIMQIHFSDDAENPDEPPLRLEMIDGELVVESRLTAGMDSAEETSLGNFAMPTEDEPLDIEMKVVDGTAQIIINGEVLYEEPLDWDGQGESAYFKAGTYNHSEGQTSVTMSSVDITHS